MHGGLADIGSPIGRAPSLLLRLAGRASGPHRGIDFQRFRGITRILGIQRINLELTRFDRHVTVLRTEAELTTTSALTNRSSPPAATDVVDPLDR
jgi:hypothetical protein